jgi:hypothetical protein
MVAVSLYVIFALLADVFLIVGIFSWNQYFGWSYIFMHLAALTYFIAELGSPFRPQRRSKPLPNAKGTVPKDEKLSQEVAEAERLRKQKHIDAAIENLEATLKKNEES